MKLKYLIIVLLIFSSTCFAFLGSNKDKYNVMLNPNRSDIESAGFDTGDITLFILDYSNSMNEMLYNSTKYEMLLESMKLLMTKTSDSDKIGLRLYGHRWGLTPIDACKASSLVIPVGLYNTRNISGALSKYKPRGMTPITYSLKQAVNKDFKGLDGNKHIILITDGGENCDESPCKYAMELVKYRKDIKIDVIAFNLDNDADLDQLECVAKVTKGKLYQADTKAELIKSMNSAFKAKKNVDAKILY